MRTRPLVATATPLPKLEDEEWDKVHYVLALVCDLGVVPLSVGDTISECKNGAISSLIKVKLNPRKMEETIARIGLVNLNDSIIYQSAGGKSYNKMGIYLCEGKVYIYAQRYGLRGMRLLFDNNFSQPYLRYEGYNKETDAKFKSQF